MHMLYILSMRYGLWLLTRLCCLCTQGIHYIEHRLYKIIYIECVEAEAWLNTVNIMVQVQGYTCYTLFNILCIIIYNIIIINSHKTSSS